MRIFIKLKPVKSILDEIAMNIKTVALSRKGHSDEILREVWNCNNIWIEVEKRGDEYFPVALKECCGLFIPKDQIEDKIIIL